MRFLLIVSFLGLTLAAAAAEGFTTPAAGSPLRKAILDVIRVPTEEHLGEPVVFKVEMLRTTGDWAFFVGTAIKPGGGEINYRSSKEYKKDPNGTKEAFAAGALFGGVDALLRKKGDAWTIVEITYDATEAHWFDYGKRFGTPKALFSGMQ